MKKLYEVEERYYVMAEDVWEAKFVRPDSDATTKTVFETKTVDAEWMDLIPFGGDDDKTCRQILENK